MGLAFASREGRNASGLAKSSVLRIEQLGGSPQLKVASSSLKLNGEMLRSGKGKGLWRGLRFAAEYCGI